MHMLLLTLGWLCALALLVALVHGAHDRCPETESGEHEYLVTTERLDGRRVVRCECLHCLRRSSGVEIRQLQV